MILENVEVVVFAYANNTYLCFLSEKILSFIKKDCLILILLLKCSESKVYQTNIFLFTICI